MGVRVSQCANFAPPTPPAKVTMFMILPKRTAKAQSTLRLTIGFAFFVSSRFYLQIVICRKSIRPFDLPSSAG